MDSSQPKSEIQAVLFDLDNTLYDRDFAFTAWTRGFVEEQFSGESADRREEILQDLILLDAHGYVTKRAFFTQVKARYPHITAEVETLCERFYREWLVHMILEDETIQLLDALDAANIPFGIITNGPVQQSLKIKQLVLEPRARCIFISDIFGCAKPDPAIFRAAADALAVPCEQILFVGDNPEADIFGAESAGMTTAWLHRGTEWPSTVFPDTIPDYSLDSLHQLSDILRLA